MSQTADRTRLGFVLIAASLLVGVAALFHPVLTGDGAAQLGAIAATRGWRPIHLSISFGYVLAVAGVAGLSLRFSGPGAAMVRLGASLAIFGYAVSLVGVLFMLGAADAMAGAYQRRGGDPEIALLYDLLHPFALGALRIGAFAVSLGILAFGWATQARPWPAWLGRFAVAAGLSGAAVALALPEHSPAIVTGIGLALAWQFAVGVWLLVRSDGQQGATSP